MKFQKDNLFNTQKVGNLLYYFLNKEHPIYNELKSIIFKISGVEGGLRKLLLNIPNINLAFIFGSFAAKKENSFSDVDIMIIGNPDISSLNQGIAALEQELKREINLTIYSMEEYKLPKNKKK